MILVRLVFQAKFGHAAEVVAGFKQGAEIARSAGGKGPRHVRILTDLSGPFDTVVQELKSAAIGAFIGGVLGVLGAIFGGWAQGQPGMVTNKSGPPDCMPNAPKPL